MSTVREMVKAIDKLTKENANLKKELETTDTQREEIIQNQKKRIFNLEIEKSLMKQKMITMSEYIVDRALKEFKEDV